MEEVKYLQKEKESRDGKRFLLMWGWKDGQRQREVGKEDLPIDGWMMDGQIEGQFSQDG